jgi:acetyl-CoA acetyltransferase
VTTKKNEVVDLDALVTPPLPIKVGGKEYKVSVDVETMIALERAQADDDASQMVLAEKIMEAAGFPAEEFRKLGVKQAMALNEAITERFFPEVIAAEAETPASTGPTPSPPSSGT